MQEISYNDLMQPMGFQEYVFGQFRDMKAQLIFEVMASVLNRKPVEEDAKDFELERDNYTQREFLVYKNDRLGEIKLNHLTPDKIEQNDSFQWQFIGVNIK